MVHSPHRGGAITTPEVTRTSTGSVELVEEARTPEELSSFGARMLAYAVSLGATDDTDSAGETILPAGGVQKKRKGEKTCRGRRLAAPPARSPAPPGPSRLGGACSQIRQFAATAG